MSDLLERVQALVAQRGLRVSLHSFRELAADGILSDDIVTGIDAAIAVEQYPAFVKGPGILALQRDGNYRPVHVVWAIPKERTTPAVLVMAYRPDPERWSADFLRRRQQ